MRGLLIMVILFSIPVTAQLGGSRIIDIESDYDSYGWDANKNRFTARDSRIYEFMDDGSVKVRFSDTSMIGTYHTGFTYNIGLSPEETIITNLAYDWQIIYSNYTETEIVEELDDKEEYINVTYRWVVYEIKLNNSDDNIHWNKTFKFYPHRDMKMTDEIGHSYLSLTNFETWYIFEPYKTRNTIQFADQTISINGSDPQLSTGTLNDVFPTIRMDGITFFYEDLILNDFDIVDIYIGNGSKFNLEKNVFALAVKKSTGLMLQGSTLELDPDSTGFVYPNNYDRNWTAWNFPNNLLADDASYSSATITTQKQDVWNFTFNFPSGITNFDGIMIEDEGYTAGWGRKAYKTNYRLSPNNALFWTTDWKEKTYYSAVSQQTYGGSSDTWGRTWSEAEFGEEWFIVGFNLSSLTGTFATAYKDYVKVNVYYTVPTIDVNYSANSPSDGDTIGSTLYVNITSGSEQHDNCSLESNQTGTFVNYSMFDIHNETNWSIIQSGRTLGIDNGTAFQYKVYCTPTSGADIVNSSIVNVIVHSLDPELTMNKPVAGYLTNDTVGLNFTVADNESDFMEYHIMLSRNVSNLNQSLYDVSTEQKNSTIIINLSHIPVETAYWLQNNSLFAHYRFNNDPVYGESKNYTVGGFHDGFYIYDHSGHNRFGSPSQHNEPEVGIGKFWNAYNFTGTDRIVNWTNEWGRVCTDSTCTFSTWVNFEDGGTGYIMEWGGQSAPIRLKWYATYQYMRWFIYNGTGFVVACDTGSDYYYRQQDEWMHIAVTYNKTHAVTYINGSILATNTCARPEGLNLTAWYNGIDEPMCSGALCDVSSTELDGLLDEMAVFNRSLSDKEINLLYTTSADSIYYYNISVWDSPNTLVSFQNNYTQKPCQCDSSNCTVDARLNCTFVDPIDLGSTPIYCFGTGLGYMEGITQWLSDVNTSKITAIDGCKGIFYGKVKT